MKIVQIVRNFSDGGGERFVVDLSNELYRKGHEVIIVRFYDEQDFNFFEPEINSNIRIITLKKKKLGFEPSLIPKLYAFIVKEKPDVVHTHLNGFIYATLCFLFLRKISYFHTLHNLPLKEATNRLDMKVRKFFFGRKLVTPVAIADEALEESRKVYGLQNIPLVYNGRAKPHPTKASAQVETYINSLRNNPATKVIVHIGRISEQKNQLLLVKTVKHLNKEGANLKLLLIGSSRSEELWKALKEEANEDIKLLGSISNVQDYLFLSDAFALSSLWEGMPISLIEAFSAGCIPICTPAGGVASMIKDGMTGFIAASFKEQELIKAFKRYLNCSPQELHTISQNGKQQFDHLYGISNCADNYAKLYQQKKQPSLKAPAFSLETSRSA